MIDSRSVSVDPTFVDMSNIVHIDEKWFNAPKKIKKFYLLLEEEDPLLTVQNKNSVNKLIFLATVGKPKLDLQGNCRYDGKIGIWPFVTKVILDFFSISNVT